MCYDLQNLTSVVCWRKTLVYEVPQVNAAIYEYMLYMNICYICYKKRNVYGQPCFPWVGISRNPNGVENDTLCSRCGFMRTRLLSAKLKPTIISMVLCQCQGCISGNYPLMVHGIINSLFPFRMQNLKSIPHLRS